MRGASRSVRVTIVGIVAMTVLGALAVASAVPRSLRTSPEEFLQTIGLLQPEDEGFDPAPLQEGSEASEHASQTAIDVLTVVEAWRIGEFDSGCEFGQAVAAAARGDEENGDDPFDPCANGGSDGQEASAAGRAKGAEMSAAGKAKGRAAAEAGKAKGAEASAAARAGGGPGGDGGSGPPPDIGPPPGAGPPGGTPGGP